MGTFCYLGTFLVLCFHFRPSLGQIVANQTVNLQLNGTEVESEAGSGGGSGKEEVVIPESLANEPPPHG